MKETILDILTHRVRLATSSQLATLLQSTEGRKVTVRQIRRRLRHMAEEGTVLLHHLALKVFAPEQFLYQWRPGEPFTAAEAIAWKAAVRVASTIPRRCMVCRVTEKGAKRDGSGGNRPTLQPTQIEHDLGCTAMLIHELRHDPYLLRNWVGEDEIRRSFRPLWPEEFRKVPDAAIVRSDDRVERFLEFCGQYSAQRIDRFHRHCRRYRIPYRLY
jgi:hypothetical protein